MPISFVAQANNIANAASISINTPAGVQAGDLLIAAIYNGSASDTITTPAGWNLLGRWANTTIGRHLTIFWKIAGASEPTSTTFTGSVSTRRAGFIAAYRGVNQANPWDAYTAQAQTTAGTSHATPSITPSQNGCMIVGIVGLSTSTSSTPPSGWTERVDRGTTNATITEADILQGTAQAISGTFVSAASTTSIKFIGALAPQVATTYQRRANGNALGATTASSARSARRQASAQALLTGTAAPSWAVARRASGVGYGAATANSTLAARRAASGLALGQTTASTAYAARRTSLAQGYGSSTASIGLRFDRQTAFASLGQSQGASNRAARRAASGAGLGYANAGVSAAYRRGGSYFGLGLAGAEQTRATPRRLLATGNAASSAAATRSANRRMAAALEAVAQGTAQRAALRRLLASAYGYGHLEWTGNQFQLAARYSAIAATFAYVHRTAGRGVSYLLSVSPQADAVRYVRRTTTLYGILGSEALLSISRTYDDFIAPQYYTYGDAPWRTPEVVLAAGPRSVGDTGDGSYATLHGYAYVGAIVDGIFRLWQLHNANGLPYSLASDNPTGGRLVRVLELPLPEGARHLALAFDQAAREVIAYEVDEQVYVRQWDPVIQQYTLRGPFPGVDPVLINDATVGYFPPDSDVLLFHLTPDRKTLVMRAQRELYDTPHTIQTFETPVVLDQAVALPYQIQLLGSLSGILDATGYALRSELYPAYLNDTLGQAMLAPPSEGAYIPIVITQEFEDLLGTATLSAPATGAYIPIVIVLDLGTEAVGQAQLAAPTTGAYVPVVLVYDLGMDVLGQAQLSAPTTGAYALVVIVVDTTTWPGYTSPDALGTATLSAPTTGAYELA